MESIGVDIQKRKRIIGRVSVIFIIIIIILTFFSKTINNFLLPAVIVTEPVKGSLEESFDVDGKVELLGKEKIFSKGSWGVLDIPVYVGQEVSVGDTLAIVDTEDIAIDLESKELEILKLENDLKKYISDHKKNDVSELQRNVMLAEREMKFAQEKLLETKNLYDNSIETMKSVEQVEKDFEDKKLEYEYKKELYENKVSQKEDEDKEYQSTLNEKQIELELKKMELKKSKKDIPLNGKILSTVSGKVVAVNIEKGQSTSLNQSIIEIVKKDSPYKITWNLNSEKSSLFGIGEEVTIILRGELKESKEGSNDESNDKENIKTVLEKKPISGREYLNNSDEYMYEVAVNESEIEVFEGQRVQVYATKTSDVYDVLLPKSSLIEKNGENYVYAIKERRGALGTENYVEEIRVNIIDSDDFYCAIDGIFGAREKVVESSTKPLSDGLQVKLR